MTMLHTATSPLQSTASLLQTAPNVTLSSSTPPPWTALRPFRADTFVREGTGTYAREGASYFNRDGAATYPREGAATYTGPQLAPAYSGFPQFDTVSGPAPASLSKVSWGQRLWIRQMVKKCHLYPRLFVMNIHHWNYRRETRQLLPIPARCPGRYLEAQLDVYLSTVM